MGIAGFGDILTPQDLRVNQDDILKILNEALRLDPKAISELFASKIRCNQELAAHPTIQCGYRKGAGRPDSEKVLTIGLLGIINGLFPDPATRIAAVFDDTACKDIIGFARYEVHPESQDKKAG